MSSAAVCRSACRPGSESEVGRWRRFAAAARSTVTATSHKLHGNVGVVRQEFAVPPRSAAATGDALRFDLQTLGAVRPRSVLTALEIALAAALAVQAARLTWLLATPSSPLGSPVAASPAQRPRADLSILAQFDPFFRVAGGGGPATVQAASSEGFTLYGVRALPGGRGSAILGSEGQQRFYDVGDEVQPGLVLTVVGADHVILSRGGARQRVSFPRPAPGAAVLPMTTPAHSPSASAGEAPAVNVKRLLDQIGLTPRRRDGQLAGYQVIPRGSGEALRAAGLQRGDVLLAVDGVVLTPERVSQLQDELSQATGAELRFERNGQVMTTRIRMAP